MPKEPKKYPTSRKHPPLDAETKKLRGDTLSGWKLTQTNSAEVGVSAGRPQDRQSQLGVTAFKVDQDGKGRRRGTAVVGVAHRDGARVMDPAHSIANAINKALDPSEVGSAPVTLRDEHVESELKPHQLERQRWQGFRGRRTTCPDCGRTGVPTTNPFGIWRHLNPKTELPCKK